MKLTIEMDIPEEAAGAIQVHFARLAALQLLEQLEKQWPSFRRNCMKHDDGRPWLYFRREGRPLLDRLVVVSTECRATSDREQILELQRAMRRVVVDFDNHYPGLYSRLSAMMRDGLPLGILLRRLIGGRPVDGAKAQQTRKTTPAVE